MNKQFKFKSKSLKDFCDDNARLKAFYNTQSDDYDEKFENFKEILKEFKTNLKENLARKETEPNVVSNVLKPFFTKLGFKAENKSLKGQISIDLTLFKKDKVGVLIEAKLPTNDECPHLDDFNKKGLHQAVFYYLWERKVELNLKISYIIITDFKRFYIIDIKEFCRCFYNEFTETAFEKFYDKEQRLFKNTDDFYDEIQSIIKSEKYRNKYLTPKSEKLFDDKGNALTPSPSVEGIYLNLTPFIDNDKNDEKLFKEAFKIFSKDFLNDEFSFKDANEINEPFYKELLYILGLEEMSGKKTIIKYNGVQNNFYELIYRHLKNKNKLSNDEEKDNETIMSFIILWLNRILFIKLIEGNLIQFNDKSASFFNKDYIKDFADLNHLFFEVFAKSFEERNNDKFFALPYLNSSLFDRTDFEKNLMEISALDSYKPELCKYTQISKKQEKESNKVDLFSYLIDFLNSYNFSGKGEAKRLINPSILGKIFEKLNGYKEGSFFTPAEITMYMCKESISKVVLTKFNEKFKWQCENLKDLRLQIDRNFSEKNKTEFQSILKSIKICDPAVGSGHFLVSALNEMVCIYHQLGLLDFRCESIDIINDELIIDNGKYHYKREDTSILDTQKGLFHLKQNIIENNLFGVDINENSVQICKLRLWIELLKNSYYLTKNDENFNVNLSKETHQMQILPNIDINIKCGNSLVSYFEINRSLTHYPNIKERMLKYKQAVKDYKEGFYSSKAMIYSQIKELKNSFKSFCFQDKFKKETASFNKKCQSYSQKYSNFLAKDDEKLSLYIPQSLVFLEFDEKEALKEFKALKAEYESIYNLESNKPFEWRFEFPEVLNEQGEFMGFDLVVGNPPYIRQEEIKELKPHLAKAYEIYTGTSDIYTYFYEQGFKVLNAKGILSFITSNKFARAGYGEKLREFLLTRTTLLEFVDLNGLKVFENAVVDTCVLSLSKQKPAKSHTLNYTNLQGKDLSNLTYTPIPQNALTKEAFIFGDNALFALKSKIEKIGVPLKEWDITINYGIKTGYNEAFIIDTAKKDEILAGCDDSDKSRKPFPVIASKAKPCVAIHALTEKERTAQIIKPILRGRDIKRYSYEWAGLWIINTHNGYESTISSSQKQGAISILSSQGQSPKQSTFTSSLRESEATEAIHKIDCHDFANAKSRNDKVKIPPIDIADYPALKKHLDSFYPKLEKRADKGITPYNLRHCAYIDEFEKEKIVYPETSQGAYFMYDNTNIFLEKTSFMIISKILNTKFLLGLLNSSLITFYFKNFCGGCILGNNAYQYNKHALEKLPIPKINSSNQNLADKIINLVDKILEFKNKDKDTSEFEKKIDSLVYKLYNVSEDEILIIKTEI